MVHKFQEMEDYEFYDPVPYQGGYDIGAKYGAPKPADGKYRSQFGLEPPVAQYGNEPNPYKRGHPGPPVCPGSWKPGAVYGGGRDRSQETKGRVQPAKTSSKGRAKPIYNDRAKQSMHCWICRLNAKFNSKVNPSSHGDAKSSSRSDEKRSSYGNAKPRSKGNAKPSSKGAAQLIADGAAELISDRAAKLIPDGARKLIPDGAAKLIPDFAAKIIADGAGKLIPDGAGKLIPDGAGKLIPDGAGKLIPDGAGKLIPDGAGKLIPDGAGKLIPDGAAKLIPHGAAKLIPHGAAKLIPHGAAKLITNGKAKPEGEQPKANGDYEMSEESGFRKLASVYDDGQRSKPGFYTYSEAESAYHQPHYGYEEAYRPTFSEVDHYGFRNPFFSYGNPFPSYDDAGAGQPGDSSVYLKPYNQESKASPIYVEQTSTAYGGEQGAYNPYGYSYQPNYYGEETSGYGSYGGHYNQFADDDSARFGGGSTYFEEPIYHAPPPASNRPFISWW